MVSLKIPTSIVRAGIIKADLKEVFNKFDNSSFYFPIGLPNTDRYMIFDKNLPCLIWGSQQKSQQINYLGYNGYVSFTSYDERLNKKNIDNFEKITGEKLYIFIPSELEKQIIWSACGLFEQALGNPNLLEMFKQIK